MAPPAGEGWELRAGAVFVLKGGSKAQEIHLDWHYKQISGGYIDPEYEWCDDSSTFFCPLEDDRPIMLQSGDGGEELRQRPGDLTIVSANTWHGGLPQLTCDAPVIFGYLDRVRKLNLAAARGDVASVISDLGEGGLPIDYSCSIVMTRSRAALVSTVRRLWTDRH